MPLSDQATNTNGAAAAADAANGTSQATGGQHLGASAAAGDAAASPPLSEATGATVASSGPATDQTSGGAGSPSSAAAQYQGIRDALKGYGLTQYAERFQDDDTALRALAYQAAQAEQLRELARYGREVQPHWDEFQRFRQEQADRQKPAKEPWWKPPEYDPRWATQIVRDPTTGELRAAPGAPPGVVDRYLGAAEHSRNFLEKFSFDPIGAIRPGLEEVIQESARSLVQQEVAAVREQMLAKELLAQNAAWMYQQGPNGQPVATPYAHVYAETVQQLTQRGVHDLTLQNEIARDRARIAMLQDQLRQQQGQAPAGAASPQAAQAAANQNFVQRAAAGYRPNAATPHAHGSGSDRFTERPSASELMKVMLADFESEGINRHTNLVGV